MNPPHLAAALRKQVSDRHQIWIREQSSQSLGDLADAFPQDVEVAELVRLTGRLYRLFYMIDDTDGSGA